MYHDGDGCTALIGTELPRLTDIDPFHFEILSKSLIVFVVRYIHFNEIIVMCIVYIVHGHFVAHFL